MFFKVPRAVKIFGSTIVLAVLGVCVVSCGSSKSASNQHKLSGLKFRAFVSNPLFPSGLGNSPVINIVDALQDIVSFSTISLFGNSNQPSIMALSPNLARTMVFSPDGNTISVLDNQTESIATVTGQTNSVPAIPLPGPTESIFIAKDNFSAYAAVPSAAVTGQAPGAVIAMDLGRGAITATIPVPAAHFIVGSPDGTHILVFSDNSDEVTVISTALIGTTSQVTTTTGPVFDRPVWAIFFDNSDAYVFNCGAECGGTSAGLTTFTIGNTAPGPVTPLSGATYGLLNGGNLYVAGTPPNTRCPTGTAATACGTLNIVSVGSMTRVNANPILIPDGYHDRMQMGANGQLFIGGRNCTSINVSGGEVRGCLSIFNTLNSKVIVPPQTGDATGIQPIAGRHVVYVCQGGAFQIYDTTTDKLLVTTFKTNNNLGITDNIVGQSYDVKLVDPPID